MKSCYMKFLCLLLLFMCFTSVSFAANVIYSSDYTGSPYKVFNLFWENNLITAVTINSDTNWVNNFNAISDVLASANHNENIRIRFENNNNPNTYTNLQVYCEVGFNYSFSSNDIIMSGNYKRYRMAVANNNTPSYNSSYNYYNANYTNNTQVGYKYSDTNSYLNNFIQYFRLNGQWYYFKSNNSRFGSNYDLSNLIRLDFNSDFTSTIMVYYNNLGELFYKVNSDLTNKIYLGNLINFENYDEVQGKFARFVGEDNQGAMYSDVIASFQHFNGNGTYSNNLELGNNGNIYIDNTLLNYNQGYSLYFEGYNNGQLVSSTDIFKFYIIPLSSNATSGDLINPNIKNDIDFGFINAINNIMNSPSR